jgi:hypothetical protein
MRDRWFKSMVLSASAILFLFSGCASPQPSSEDNRTEAVQIKLKDGIAGTYLATTDKGGRILQLHENGNLSLIMTEQLIAKGSRGESYSNTMGSWVQVGKRKVSAVTVDLAYYSRNNTYMGVGKAKCDITFNQNFSEATMFCDGRVYKPDSNPLGAVAHAIAGARYVWEPTRFQKVSAR